MVDFEGIQDDFFDGLSNGLQFCELFDYLSDVYLYVKNGQSEFMKMNPALLDRHGLKSEEEAIGKTDYDFHQRYMADQYVEEDQRVMRLRKPISNQVWLVWSEKFGLQWFLSTKIPLFNTKNEVAGIAGVMRNYHSADRLYEPYQEMSTVVSYVLDHYAEKISVVELAEMVHLSVSQFDRKFKKLFQMTPQQYLLRVRINVACEALVWSNRSVAQIANESGFFDQSYFTKQFKKMMKVAPLAYRKEYQTLHQKNSEKRD